ncbi:MAG: alkaline phosphatase family protein [Bacteroidetes bacterium]|nr:MAG: alkaline phosphatase family protein [Bacteroidota bacterium]
MKQSLKEIKTLLIRLSIALLAYPLCKIIFFFFNHGYFREIPFFEFLSILFYGLRFDLASLVLMNTPFIILHIIPFFSEKIWYRLILKTLFIALNSAAILADCIDIAYFRFALKRTTADFFDLFGLGSDISTLLPQYIRDFWYIPLIWITITFFIAWLYRKTQSPLHLPQRGRDARATSFPLGRTGWAWFSWFILNSVLIGLCIIVFRGGLQLRPIMPINASEYVSAKNIPLIVNTPFSIIKSYGLEKLEEKNYFTEKELVSLFDPIHRLQPATCNPQPATNLFIIILESFSSEYIGALSGKKTHTPFLDSLIKESLVFDNAFANGKKSLEGLPAVVAGIPGLINEPFITSIYGSNNFNSLASVLKEKKYSTAFFHGGTNGTMGFDAFSSSAGFDKYFGKTEYNNESDYDGNWGIWDEDFFQYAKKKTDEMSVRVDPSTGKKEPFLSVLFSLSSHHPSSIPEKYKTRFPEGELPILKSVEYADFSLRKFFESASKEKWFDSTLFVITADHTGPSNDPYYSSSAGIFRVPILFYKRDSNFKGINHKVTQHIDLLPTVLNYTGYDGNYFSFGHNMLDSAHTGYAVNFINDVYQLIQDDYLLQFDGNNTIAFYNYKTDSLLQNNLMGKEPEGEKPSDSYRMERKLKAIIQTYYNGMINNKLTAGRK